MKRPFAHLAATAVTAVAALLFASMPSGAQVEIPPIGSGPRPSPTPTHTPDPDPTGDPTTRPPPSGGGGGSTKPAPPKPPKDPDGGGSNGGSGGSGGGSGRDGGSSNSDSGVYESPRIMPGRHATPFGTAMVVGPPSGGEGGFGLEGWSTREKTPPRSTQDLLDVLTAVHGRDPSRAQLSSGFGRFPVLGYAWYQDDYGAPRAIGRISLHAGVDIFAPEGTPVAATIDGYIWKYARGGRGGNALWLMGKDGVRYYYGHMTGFAFPPRLGRRLRQGEIFGFVGSTGSAVGTPAHVHFEVNPGGRGTVNPKERLDTWLDAAIAGARTRMDRLEASGELVSQTSGWSTLQQFLRPADRSGTPDVWRLGFDPTSTLPLAESAVAELLAGHAWEDFVSDPFAGATGPGPSDPFNLGLESLYGLEAHGDDHTD